jgi:uncharacterized protein YdaU (DUF1376 family)
MSNSWYPRYYGDYMRDTGHLTLAQHGAYTKLLDQYYAHGKGIPADHEALFRMCSAMHDEERAAVAYVADKYFPVNGDGMRHNRRADRELAKLADRSESARQSAKARWDSNCNADAMRTHCERIANGDALAMLSTSTSTTTSREEHPEGKKSISGKPKRTALLADDAEWLASIRADYSELGVDVDREVIKARAWLKGPKGTGRKFTRQFLLRWLAKCDQQIGVAAAAKERHYVN